MTNKDKSIEKNALILDGKKYEKGIGTHANSEIVYKLDGKYSRFLSDIGVDDESIKMEVLYLKYLEMVNFFMKALKCRIRIRHRK